MKSLSVSTLKEAKTLITAMVFCFLVVFISAANTQADFMPPDLAEELQAKYPDGLPHYMTPEEQQWLDQQAATAPMSMMQSLDVGTLYVQPPGASAPPTGVVWAPGEYEPLDGILVRWTTGSSYDTALRGMVAQASQATTVWCFVENASQQSAATTAFSAAGANMSNVVYITYDSDSIWIRDFGPRYFYENSGHAIMDHITIVRDVH